MTRWQQQSKVKQAIAINATHPRNDDDDDASVSASFCHRNFASSNATNSHVPRPQSQVPGQAGQGPTHHKGHGLYVGVVGRRRMVAFALSLEEEREGRGRNRPPTRPRRRRPRAPPCWLAHHRTCCLPQADAATFVAQSGAWGWRVGALALYIATTQPKSSNIFHSNQALASRRPPPS